MVNRLTVGAEEAAAAETAAVDLFATNLTLPLWAVIAACAGVILLFALVLILGRRRRKQLSAAKPALSAEKVGHVAIGKLHEQGARSEQQDSFGVSDESVMDTHGLLAVVADGMGGLADGAKVSAAAVEAVLDSFIEAQDAWPPERLLTELLRQAVGAVNGLLGPDDYRKSGSTLLMGLVRDGSFSFASVGDSRVCLYRCGTLIQLNREHIYRNDLAGKAVNGEIAVQDAFNDPKGAGLTSFLGMGVLSQVDLPAAPLRLYPGDRLLLMSDGVYNALSEEELSAALALAPEEAAEAIRRAIQEKNYSNQDNYTAVILACAAQDAAEDGK